MQEAPAVFVTRAAGAYTTPLAAAAFGALPQRVATGELREVKAVQMFFDTELPAQEVAALCSLACVVCAAVAGAAPPTPFATLNQCV